MKNVIEKNNRKKSAVRINPALDKYDEVVLFPEKVEEAKAFFAKHGIPDFITKKEKKD